MSELGRDKLWAGTTIWKDIDKAVADEVGPLRVAQKVFPTEQRPGASNVPDDKFNPKDMTIKDGPTVSIMDISVEFSLTCTQVENEMSQRTARTLAKRAARSVALAQDLLFFQGKSAPVNVPEAPSPFVSITNIESAGEGLFNLQSPFPARLPKGTVGEAIFTALNKGIAELTRRGHPGPYALILGLNAFAETYATVPNTLTTAADRIIPLVEKRFFGSAALPDLDGLLVSLGGAPTTIYVAQDTITAYTQQDTLGNYRFRVFERVQMVTGEPEACFPIDFSQPA